MRMRWLSGMVMFVLFPLAVRAQDPPAPSQTTDYKYVYGEEDLSPDPFAKPPSSWSAGDVASVLELKSNNLNKLVALAGGVESYKKMLKAIEDSRLDKQTGASASSEGTTSLVTKGVASQILDLAVEEGALTRTDNKTISTFHGSAISIARFLRGVEQFPYCPVIEQHCQSALENALDGLSFGLSVDTSPGSQASTTVNANNTNNAVLSSASRGSISGWNLRYDFHVRRSQNINPTDFINKIGGVQGGSDYLTKAGALFDPIKQSDRYNKWLSKYEAKWKDSPPADDDGLKVFLAQAATELVEISRQVVPDFDTKLDAFVTAMGTYFGKRDQALETLIYRWTYSVEYDNDRPLNQPSQSTAKAIVSGRLDDSGKHQLTFNSTATWYDQAPPQAAVRRFRDAQASLQIDLGLTPDTARIGASFSAGYYFQWMADNALLTIPSGNLAPGTSITLPGDASVLLNTKGTISIGQAGVTFTFKNGVKLPITISYANRTELLKANTVRGHFGLSYDLDSFFAGK